MPELQRRAYVAESYERDASDGTMVVTISTGATDRFNTVLDPGGWDLANYRANPVVMWAHQRDQLPIATCKRVWLEGDKLKAKIDWTDAIELNPFAATVKSFYERGLLRGWSVGFLPKRTVTPEKSGGPVTFKEMELVEFSAALIPANPGALLEDKTLSRAVADAAGYTQAELRQLVDARGAQVAVDEIVDRTLRSPQPGDKSWDPWGARRRVWAWARGDSRKYQKACAVGGRLPHHDVESGSLVTIWNGVREAMSSVMSGALPRQDARLAYDHLAAHYRQFKKTPPEWRTVEEVIAMSLDVVPDGTEGLQRARDLFASGKVDEGLAVVEGIADRAQRDTSPNYKKRWGQKMRAAMRSMRVAHRHVRETTEDLEAAYGVDADAENMSQAKDPQNKYGGSKAVRALAAQFAGETRELLLRKAKELEEEEEEEESLRATHGDAEEEEEESVRVPGSGGSHASDRPTPSKTKPVVSRGDEEEEEAEEEAARKRRRRRAVRRRTALLSELQTLGATQAQIDKAMARADAEEEEEEEEAEEEAARRRKRRRTRGIPGKDAEHLAGSGQVDEEDEEPMDEHDPGPKGPHGRAAEDEEETESRRSRKRMRARLRAALREEGLSPVEIARVMRAAAGHLAGSGQVNEEDESPMDEHDPGPKGPHGRMKKEDEEEELFGKDKGHKRLRRAMRAAGFSDSDIDRAVAALQRDEDAGHATAGEEQDEEYDSHDPMPKGPHDVGEGAHKDDNIQRAVAALRAELQSLGLTAEQVEGVVAGFILRQTDMKKDEEEADEATMGPSNKGKAPGPARSFVEQEFKDTVIQIVEG
jgi:hypothetical protein